jgi:HK97 family phage major capsid protein
MAAAADQARGIQAAADTASRDLSSDESESITALLNKFEALSEEIARRERIENATSRLSQPQRAVRPESGIVTPVRNAGGFGFREVGEFFNALRERSTSGVTDARLRNAVSVYGNETTGADGGYALPPDFRAGVTTMLRTPNDFLSYCDPLFTPSNKVTMPMDEDLPWGATGIQFDEDVAEATEFTSYKPAIKQLNITLAKVGGIINLTEESIEDGTELAPYVQSKAADKLKSKLNARAMSAFLASPAKVPVTKTTGAAANSPADLDNVLKMHASMPVEWQDESCVWVINPLYKTVLPKLVLGQMPIYLPGGSLQGKPLDTLLGCKIIWSPYSSAVGTEGDIMLVAGKQFFAAQKSVGVKTDVTPYFAWAQDIQSFKVSVRVGFKSKWAASFAYGTSGITSGNVITLATRA